MCDYSLTGVRSRPAQVADKLITRDFGTGTRGFAAARDPGLAVCILPGTELSFTSEIKCLSTGLFPWRKRPTGQTSAIFRQINKEKTMAHHDALEFSDGQVVLLTHLCFDQEAQVLQLPAMPKTAEEESEQQRVAYVG